MWRGSVIFAKPNEWFLNTDEDFIYYSDRYANNRLHKKSDVEERGALVIDEPSACIHLYGNRIYYINEDDMTVNWCFKDGSERTQCSEEKTYEFGIADDIVYINSDARRLCLANGMAYYADSNNGYRLTIHNIRSGEKKTFDDIIPSFLNVYEDDIYFTDRMRENRIFRLGSSGERLSIYGGSAECLHVLGDYLYFLSERKWKKLSLVSFGEAQSV